MSQAMGVVEQIRAERRKQRRQVKTLDDLQIEVAGIGEVFLGLSSLYKKVGNREGCDLYDDETFLGLGKLLEDYSWRLDDAAADISEYALRFSLLEKKKASHRKDAKP
jgi:hypothetical protein